MALSYRQLGNMEKAKEYRLKAVELQEKHYPNHVWLGTGYINLSTTLNEMGETGLAKEYAIKGLKVYEQIEKDANYPIRLAIAHNNLGMIYSQLKQYKEAKEYLGKAKSFFETNSNAFNLATNLYNLALAEAALKEFDSAKQNVKRAINYFEEVEKKLEKVNYERPDQPTQQDMMKLFNYRMKLQKEGISTELPVKVSLGHARNLLARIESENGSTPQRSIEMVEEFIRTNSAMLGEQHPEMARHYNELAMLYFQRGELQKAKTTMEKALYIGKEKLNKNNPLLMVYYNNYSVILLQMNNQGLYSDLRTILGFKRLSFNVFRNSVDNNFNYLDTGEQLNYLHSGDPNEHIITWLKMAYLYTLELDKRQRGFLTKDILHTSVEEMQKFLSLSETEQQSIKEAQKEKSNIVPNIADDWLNYKGAVFDNQNFLNMIYSSTQDNKVKQNINKLKRLTQKLSTLYQKFYIEAKEKKENETQIEQIKKERNEVELTLNKQSKKFRETLNLKSITYMDISNSLHSHELYIDFVDLDNIYLIIAIGSNGKLGIIDIMKSDTQSIRNDIDAYRGNIQKVIKNINNKIEITSELKQESNAILSRLYNILIRKYLGQVIENKKELIISPDGVLNFLPFEALHHKGKYLLEDKKITYITSGKEFMRQQKREQRQPSQEIVVFGSPNYEMSLPALEKVDDNKSTTELPPQFLSQYFDFIDSSKEIARIKKSYPNAKIYQDKKATVENLMRVNSPKILHISTHGLYLDDKNITNPMQRSFLTFAGANMASFNANTDGIATALKLSSLNLQNTELVILSACETGVGKIYNAQGVSGLSKAFIQAGSQQVIMSLWSVSDQKTTMLMEYLYDFIDQGDDYATALQKAKLKMINLHPYYWSGFVMSGI
jgi:CHAT domain-containing protein/Tfp pilus assembly protein PilF